MKKLLISISNIVTNFTFRNKIGKVFGYINIYYLNIGIPNFYSETFKTI